MKAYLRKISRLGLSLAKANFKLRTEGSYLGVLWYLLDPILLFTILIFVFGSNLGAQIKLYPLYLIWGLALFNFFSAVTSQATSVIAGNSLFIKSMKINSEALVVSVLFQTIFSHVFELAVLLALMIYWSVSLAGLVFYPAIFLFFALFTLGVSFILAALGVYVSDLNNVWKFFTQLLFFATPIFYAASPKWLLALNPLAAYLTITRGLVIYGQWPGLKIILLIAVVSLATFVLGWGLFYKVKNKFAENL
ncbi:MAG: ABC transporter permease [Candidatus Paceibacterota bacterium]|jgi:ABC-type polysaccharide/polyol phosphate export permease